VDGFGVRLAWGLAQVTGYSSLWLWLHSRLRWAGSRPDFVTFGAGLGLLCLIATFGFVGSRLPFAELTSGKKKLRLPADPSFIYVTFASLVLISFFEIMKLGSFASPCTFFIIMGTGLLATVLRDKPDRTVATLMSFLLVATVFLFAGYEHQLNRPHHTPGVPESDPLWGGAWILLAAALGIWTAIYGSTSSKNVLVGGFFGLLVVTVVSVLAILFWAYLFSLFTLWLSMAVPILAASYRLLNYLTERPEPPASPATSPALGTWD
jgi:hypothetical protein